MLYKQMLYKQLKTQRNNRARYGHVPLIVTGHILCATLQPVPPARAAVRFVSSTANVAAVALRLPTSPLSFAQRQLQLSHGVRARVEVHRRIQIEPVTAVGNAVPK